MPLPLRLVGLLAGATWLGATVTVETILPSALASDSMLRLLGAVHSGAAALIIMGHYYSLAYVCAVIAVAHAALDRLHGSSAHRRFGAYLVALLVGVTILGGSVVQPKLKRLHLEAHGVRSTFAQRERAQVAFRSWQLAGHATNLSAMFGLAVYVWLLAAAGSPSRFGSANKFLGLTNSGT